MNKFRLVILVLGVLILSACAGQATPASNTPATTNLPGQVITPTGIPSPTAPPTETSSPNITLAGDYPHIVTSTDPFNQLVSIDPGDPMRIAYCAPGEIRASQDAGQAWEVIPTTGVMAVAQESGYDLFYGEPSAEDACLSVTFDPVWEESYYAVFTAAQAEYGAPPLFYLGFHTADSGETWQLVEPPEGATLEDFGGFWNLGINSVQAQFFPAGSWSQDPEAILITETRNGGTAWQPGELSCPAVDPCLRWGPAPSNIPGMGSPLPQSIYSSLDAGENWSLIDPPVELRAPAPNQLVASSATQVMIISGGITLSEQVPPLRISNNAGASWQPVTLPNFSTEEVNSGYFPGLQYLPNNTYLSQAPEDSTWYWLPPDLPIWCPVNTDRLPVFPVLLQAAGDRVWWVDPDTQQAESISISELTCSVE